MTNIGGASSVMRSSGEYAAHDSGVLGGPLAHDQPGEQVDEGQLSP
jgi:hypothetical protein